MTGDADPIEQINAEQIKAKLDTLIEIVESLSGQVSALEASVDAARQEASR